MKIIYGDERDDPRDNSMRKRRALFFFEVFLIFPWATTLPFLPMSFHGANDISIYLGLGPYILYPVSVIVFSIIANVGKDEENSRKSYYLQALPIIIPPFMFVLVAIGNSLWQLIA